MALIRRIRTLLREVSRFQISVYAGNAAFFLLLSVLPLAILLLTLLQYLPVSWTDLTALLAPLIPEALLPLLEGLTAGLTPNRSAALISVSALATLWSASKGMLSLVYGLNAVEEVTETRTWIRRRLLCAAYTLATLAAILLTLLLQVFGQRLLGGLSRCGFSLPELVLALLKHLRLLSTLLLATFFSALYLALPDCKKRWMQVLPGALTASVAWSLFSLAFSYYVNHISNSSALYGGLSLVLFTLLWLYFCLSILYYGAVFNRFLARRKE